MAHGDVPAARQAAGPKESDAHFAPEVAFPRRTLAYMLLKHVERLTRWRVENGRPQQRDKVLRLVARVLASNPPPQAGRRSTAWPGLTYEALVQRARACRIDLPDEQEFRLLEQEFDGGDRAYIRPDDAARGLKVTREERDAVYAATGKHLTAIGSCDETADERKARRREADRAYRQEKRRAEGVIPRSIYESSSMEQLKPWETMGVSRATYFRRQATGELAANDGETSVSAVRYG